MGTRTAAAALTAILLTGCGASEDAADTPSESSGDLGASTTHSTTTTSTTLPPAPTLDPGDIDGDGQPDNPGPDTAAIDASLRDALTAYADHVTGITLYSTTAQVDTDYYPDPDLYELVEPMCTIALDWLTGDTHGATAVRVATSTGQRLILTDGETCEGPDF